MRSAPNNIPAACATGEVSSLSSATNLKPSKTGGGALAPHAAVTRIGSVGQKRRASTISMTDCSLIAGNPTISKLGHTPPCNSAKTSSAVSK